MSVVEQLRLRIKYLALSKSVFKKGDFVNVGDALVEVE